MFHVEPIFLELISKIRIGFFLPFFFLLSCGIAKQTTTIPDYLIFKNGISVLGNKSLNAFVFESNQRNIPFQQFITIKYNLVTYNEKEINILIEGEEYKLIFYDRDEFEKFIGSYNFTVLNQETNSNKTGNQSEFIAISVINSQNEDCLSSDSLYQNQIIDYLKKLKDAYLRNNG